MRGAGPSRSPAEGSCIERHVATDGSYGSANDVRVHLGLGADAAPRHVRVVWPDGETQRFGPLAVDRYHQLRRPIAP